MSSFMQRTSNFELTEQEPTMRVFLATRWEDGHLLLPVRAQLQEMGFNVTSTWLDKLGEVDADHSLYQQYAIVDYNDIKKSDMVVLYNVEGAVNERGGAYTELGLALGMGKLCVVVGERVNIYHYHPFVWHEPSLETFMRFAEAHLWHHRNVAADV